MYEQAHLFWIQSIDFVSWSQNICTHVRGAQLTSAHEVSAILKYKMVILAILWLLWTLKKQLFFQYFSVSAGGLTRMCCILASCVNIARFNPAAFIPTNVLLDLQRPLHEKSAKMAYFTFSTQNLSWKSVYIIVANSFLVDTIPQTIYLYPRYRTTTPPTFNKPVCRNSVNKCTLSIKVSRLGAV